LRTLVASAMLDRTSSNQRDDRWRDHGGYTCKRANGVESSQGHAPSIRPAVPAAAVLL
jgi:hypothetical protein